MRCEWVDAEEFHPECDKRVLVMIEGNNPRHEVSSFNHSADWRGLEEGEYVTFWAELPTFCSKDVQKHSQLSSEQRDELLNHLLNDFKYDEGYAYVCFESILVDIENYHYEYRYSRADILEYKELSRAARDAYDLYATCKRHPFLETYMSSCYGLASSLRELARGVEGELKDNKRPGRPTTVGPRNKLINEIYGNYPNSKRGAKSPDSRFQQLIGKVLKWVEPSPPQTPEALHQAIMRAIDTKH